MATERKRPVRILHVVGGMNVGGVETWLVQVLRNIDREQYRMDFLVHTDKPCVYDEEIRSLGSAIIPCLHPTNLPLYAFNFFRALKQYGPYDVVHSHVHHFSGFIAWLSKLAGVPARIVHSHSDTSTLRRPKQFFRESYLRCTKYLIKMCATAGLACSRQAAKDLYGETWEKDERWRLLYCGVDLKPFRASVDRLEVRKEFGIADDAFVLGHVGRFSAVKNHSLLIDIFAEVVRQEPRAHLLLIGDGPLRDEVVEKVNRLGLQSKVSFAGIRSDVPKLMKGAMDIFVFPSCYEGLGLVIIEAQAAGIPCIINATLPAELDVVNGAIKRMKLVSSANAWVYAVLNFKRQQTYGQRILASIENSKFNLSESISELENLYYAK